MSRKSASNSSTALAAKALTYTDMPQKPNFQILREKGANKEGMLLDNYRRSGILYESPEIYSRSEVPASQSSQDMATNTQITHGYTYLASGIQPHKIKLQGRGESKIKVILGTKQNNLSPKASMKLQYLSRNKPLYPKEERNNYPKAEIRGHNKSLSKSSTGSYPTEKAVLNFKQISNIMHNSEHIGKSSHWEQTEISALKNKIRRDIGRAQNHIKMEDSEELENMDINKDILNNSLGRRNPRNPINPINPINSRSCKESQSGSRSHSKKKLEKQGVKDEKLSTILEMESLRGKGKGRFSPTGQILSNHNRYHSERHTGKRGVSIPKLNLGLLGQSNAEPYQVIIAKGKVGKDRDRDRDEEKKVRNKYKYIPYEQYGKSYTQDIKLVNKSGEENTHHEHIHIDDSSMSKNNTENNTNIESSYFDDIRGEESTHPSGYFESSIHTRMLHQILNESESMKSKLSNYFYLKEHAKKQTPYAIQNIYDRQGFSYTTSIDHMDDIPSKPIITLNDGKVNVVERNIRAKGRVFNSRLFYNNNNIEQRVHGSVPSIGGGNMKGNILYNQVKKDINAKKGGINLQPNSQIDAWNQYFSNAAIRNKMINHKLLEEINHRIPKNLFHKLKKSKTNVYVKMP